MAPLQDDGLTDVIEDLVQVVRNRWDRLGFLETDTGAFATGHIPAVGPHAYLCRFYAGLAEAGLDAAEAESERYLPQPYREFLRSFNGGKIMGVSLYGATGGQNLRIAEGIGQPVSIRYQNAFYLRKEFIPEGHFGFGSINGPRYSQGHLYLTSVGEVELINRDHNLVATRWPSFKAFLEQEFTRQMSRYDDEGRETGEVAKLPGNSENWEALGKESSDRRRKESSVLHRVFRSLRGLREY